MQQRTQSNEEQQFAALVARIFSDSQFAESLQRNPESALKEAGFQLSDEQRKAVASGQMQTGDASVAAFVAPVVRVLTRPVVSVVTGTIVASAPARDDKR